MASSVYEGFDEATVLLNEESKQKWKVWTYLSQN